MTTYAVVDVALHGECQGCRHSWGAHRGRNGGERCWFSEFGRSCPCRRKNPATEAEDRLAAALWRMVTR